MSIESGYLRFPSIRGDTVVFVSEDDLWSVSADGGPALRLSANPGQASHPRLSPDGRWIAFVGRDEGQTEVWVMPAEGGGPRRLTHLGATTQVVGWSPDGSAVIFASDADQPFLGQIHLSEVPVAGGPSRTLGLGPARAVAYRPDGPGLVLGRNTGDPARWKRYRGGTAGNLWIDSRGTGRFRRLVDLPGNLTGPMWIGDRIWFVSDHEGVGNLYSCRTSGKDLRRHTDHEEFYARFPDTDGRRIVYASGADLRLHDPETGEDRRIDVRLSSARPQRNRKFADAARYLESYALHPEGHSLAVVSRGKPFTFPLWEDAVSQAGKPDGVRYRLARWLPDGKRLVAVSDDGGEERLTVLSATGRPRAIDLETDLGRAVDLAVAPAGGNLVAVSNHRYEVVVADLKKGEARVVDRSRYERVQGMAWSPDGRWLAFALPESFQTAGLKVLDTKSGEVHRVTRPDFKDYAPAFDPEGKYLYFLSIREYDPVYDQQIFDLGFPRGGRMLAVPLRADLPSPFEPTPRAPAPPGNGPKKPEKNGGGGGKPPAVEIDLDGIEDRVVAFPVPDGIYGQVAGMKGKVLFTSLPIEGSLSRSWFPSEPPARASLEAFDLTELKKETLLEGVTSFDLSADGKSIVVRAGRRLRALPAGVKPEAGSEQKAPGRESGWIDLSRVRVSVDPAQEWAQMYREAWRLMRDQFWTPDMSGVDWVRVYRRYLPLLDRVTTRSEFSDLLWEMQGELGTSHSYELGGDYRPEPGYQVGLLGADLEFDDAARVWRIARIPRGDSWKKDAASPLAAPGANLRPGDRLLEVGHRKVDRRHSPGERLVNLAGEKVVLTVAGPEGEDRRQVVVRTLGNDRPLRYRDWVERNRARVHEETDGRAGYVHVPNMGPLGYAEFHRYYLAELSRDGLVVDVRFNGGGHVSQLLLEKLLRRRVGYDTQRWGEPMPYPGEAVLGPLVALTNEYAGSDGDIFSHCFKLYGLGPLIGKRTWGGVVGIWPRHTLVDGTVTTQPEFSFWFEDVGFGVENHGTDPDIEVEIRPQDHAAGRDPQMDRGIREIKRLLRERKPGIPDFGDRPKTGAPKLPDR